MAQAQMHFPSDFRWGTATAAYQVEGYNTNSDWWPWEQQDGRILHNHKSGLASNWWENAEQDLDIAANLHTNAHRLSLEWSRIEPEPSVFDSDALDRYRQILQAMHDRHIEPMVTLHHFSNPLWLVEKGDFNNQIIVEYFQRYTAKVVDALGDLIPKWITINEPLVYVFMRYLSEDFPAPQKSGWFPAMEAVQNLVRCHAVAYHTIKDALPQAEVGFAKNFPVLEAKPGSRLPATWWAGQLSRVFNDIWLMAVQDGRLRWPVGRAKIKGAANSFDFIGINYYTRFFVKFPPRAGFYETEWGPEAIVTDGQYGEIYPAGLYQVINKVRHLGKPLYITENGLPDAADKHRAFFIMSHLREIWRAINFCYPVMGYYHWSLVDNFEWDRGWTQRFGLIELDPETQTRQLRTSGHLYGEICRRGMISSQMAEQYAPALLPTMFPGQAPATTREG